MAAKGESDYYKGLATEPKTKLKFVIQKLAQRRKDFGFCQVIIQCKLNIFKKEVC